MERLRRKSAGRGGHYFPTSNTAVECVPTGCAVLDGVLGGGWALGHVANIVGDQSSGKTLLAIEACANFHACAPRGKIWYRESEAAFDVAYAKGLGLPLDKVNFGPQGEDTQWDTVEDIFEDLERKLDYLTRVGKARREKGLKPRPGLYIVDSLDALSSRAELTRKINEKTYGTEKAKSMSELFRRLVRKARRARCAIIIISQTRDKIGVVFGEKHTRTGGKAMNFYAYQILWLSHMKTHFKKIMGIRQASGVRVRARAKKNKLTLPNRQCDFDIKFGWGIDDFATSLAWLKQAKQLKQIGLTNRGMEAYLKEIKTLDKVELRKRSKQIRDVVLGVWSSMADRMRPKVSKY